MIAQGYAITWGDVAEVDGHRETIARGAFQHARRGSLRVAHGRAAAAVAWNVRLAEDDYGLRFACQLNPGCTDHRRIAAAVRYDGLNQVSLGFRALRSRWEVDLEVIEQARLLELSLTGDAAYQASHVEIVEGELPVWPDRPPDADEQPAAAYAAWPRRLEPQALAKLARRNPVQAMARAHMARYLARIPA